MKKQKIKEVLDFDALHEAEKLTGKSYKNDKFTESLGFIAYIQNSKRKEQMLKSLGDTTFNNTEENYLKIVKDFGFESALIEPFINEDGIEERLHIMWHNYYSILLVFDTHTCGDDGSFAKAGKDVPPPSVNGGKFYYNWSPKIDCKSHCTSSGGYVCNGDLNNTYATLFNKDFTPHILPDELRKIEPKLDYDNFDEYKTSFDNWCVKVGSYIADNNLVKIWSGDHDCREAIKFNINQLAENGVFVKKWQKTPFLWLLHYMDTKNDDYDYKEINKQRLKKLPKHILTAMGINI